MQLGARENEEERFTHYSDKTFKKTASLIAYSCQAVCAFLFSFFIPENTCFIIITGLGSFGGRLQVANNCLPIWSAVGYGFSTGG